MESEEIPDKTPSPRTVSEVSVEEELMELVDEQVADNVPEKVIHEEVEIIEGDVAEIEFKEGEKESDSSNVVLNSTFDTSTEYADNLPIIEQEAPMKEISLKDDLLKNVQLDDSAEHSNLPEESSENDPQTTEEEKNAESSNQDVGDSDQSENVRDFFKEECAIDPEAITPTVPKTIDLLDRTEVSDGQSQEENDEESIEPSPSKTPIPYHDNLRKETGFPCLQESDVFKKLPSEPENVPDEVSECDDTASNKPSPRKELEYSVSTDVPGFELPISPGRDSGFNPSSHRSWSTTAGTTSGRHFSSSTSGIRRSLETSATTASLNLNARYASQLEQMRILYEKEISGLRKDVAEIKASQSTIFAQQKPTSSTTGSMTSPNFHKSGTSPVRSSTNSYASVYRPGVLSSVKRFSSPPRVSAASLIPHSSFSATNISSYSPPMDSKRLASVVGNHLSSQQSPQGLALRCEYLESTLQTALNQLEESEGELDRVSSRLNHVSLQAADLESENSSLQAEVASLQTTNRSMTIDLEESKSRVAHLENDVADLNKVLDMKERSIQEDDLTIGRLMKEYDELARAHDSLKIKLNITETSVQDSKGEVNGLRRSLNQVQFDLRRLESENDLLTKRLQASTSGKPSGDFSFGHDTSVEDAAPVARSPSPSRRPYVPLSRSPGGKYFERHHHHTDQANDAKYEGLRSTTTVTPRSRQHVFHHRDNHIPEQRATSRGKSSQTGVDHSSVRKILERAEEISKSVRADFSNSSDELANLRGDSHSPPSRLSGGKGDVSHSKTVKPRFLNEDPPPNYRKSTFATETRRESPKRGGIARFPHKSDSPSISEVMNQHAPRHTGIIQSARTSSATDTLAKLTSVEQQFDSLLNEKRRLESCLARVPVTSASGPSRIRQERASLERSLDEVDKKLGTIRITLKKFNVLKSSIN